ncbi:hypothetical protein GCM10010334_77230 [Streptomyces finlayi]|uniref:Uncharacterized protein n=1 Tax=Streptomyces finlayi TaxID=67296 RepID=A0A918X796_9ACTN|nr:hypothetical protein [Streptomyces finlayi]GHD16275.1 hypothetical protein GCM10010334_77230 [Streptomyces finlayi]
MDLQTLTLLLRARWTQLRTAGDRGATSTEIAVIAGALLLGAGAVVVAIRTKLLEKIGIIQGG